MKDFATLCATFHSTAWRLEVRDSYNIPAELERAAEFGRTGDVPTKTRHNNEWIATVENARARSAYIGRVRLVGRPITDYTRFEVAAYRDNVGAGEDIRLLERAWLDESWNDAPDVWVFDDHTALKMLYDETGAWLGTEEIHAAPYARLRRVIVPHAVPWPDYVLTVAADSRFVPVSFTDALESL